MKGQKNYRNGTFHPVWFKLLNSRGESTFAVKVDILVRFYCQPETT